MVGKLIILLLMVGLVGAGLTWQLWPGGSSAEEERLPISSPAVTVSADAPKSTWISPGKYHVRNLGPGDTADVPVTLHNGNSVETSWSVEARAPTNPSEGYEPWPWPESVTIVIPAPTLAPGEILPIPIELSMPEDVEYDDKRTEVWLVFHEQGQQGMIHTELATKVQIETR